MTITANANGEIVQKSIIEGEIVDPEKTLFLIRDSQSLVINGFVPAAAADKIHTGSPVEVVLPGETKRRLSGGISYISDKAVVGKDKYSVRARVNSGGAKLKPGTTLKMRISL
ncbi:MAG: efflux RND transporter periplasmic adaptor subunit [Candidatus Obscuribacterales bacterium]|nr:efflux RND transporter periplasmic adaptor subunit [Candidatus Obscuribacterales bacterium]